MDRWSFRKRLGSISFYDFRRLARQFCDTVDACYPGSSKVTVTFYKNLPGSVTMLDEGLMEFVARLNAEGELAKVDRLENATKELFDKAVNVQLLIVPAEEEKAPRSTFGHLECKGLRNDLLTYYIQPDVVARSVRGQILGEGRPSVFKFGTGKGFEHLHRVSLR